MKRKISTALGLILVILTLVSSLYGCANKKNALHPDTISDNYRVFYEIFVGSFSDSDSDGCGDLRGIINRMDYLNDGDTESGKSLGVQGIWLSPIFQSPSYHKYDAADYYKIDSEFGSEEDLVELIELCHERNVKVILDLVLNHTSSSNVMFQKFTDAHKRGDTTSEYYDFYTHCTAETRKSGHTYEKIPGCSGEYYECNFSADMPEPDFDNPSVRQYAVDLAKYYLDLGIDGFRFDAVKYIYYSDTKKSVDFWKWYMDELYKIKEDVYCVGECWSGEGETLTYIEAMNCFNFQMSQSEGFIANAAKGTTMSIFTDYIERYSKSIAERNGSAMIIPFISNHDMDRSAGYVTLATKRMYMAANLYILSSGSPFMYYGEEIGLKGSRGASNTDANRRLAMLWGDGDTVSDPIGTTYDKSKQTNGTAAEHVADEGSLYNHYRRLIAMRNKYPEIARGKYESVKFDNATFGGFVITYKDSMTGLFHNTSDDEITIDLADGLAGSGFTPTVLCDFIGQGEASLNGTSLTLGPKTSVIIK